MTALITGAILYAIGFSWMAYELATAPWGETTPDGYGPVNPRARQDGSISHSQKISR